MDDNWDLHAIVRGMIGATAYSSGGGATASHFSDHTVSCVPNIHKPFYNNLQSAFQSPQEAKITNDFNTTPSHNHNHFAISETAPVCFQTNATTTLDNRSKRRRNVAKLIKNVGLKEVGSDVWSWRKYGEKRIEGSPYPRGYYRCSTSKECMARKKVEKNRSDPRMLTLIYTGEHNHPIPTHHNSLAGRGRTRLKPSPPPPPAIATTVSAKIEEDLTVDDDLFAGLDDLFTVDSLSGIL